MIDPREDQAAGLRRLFRRAPPTVVALYATGRHGAHNALRAAHAIAGRGERVILLDEAPSEASLAARLALRQGPDLLSVVDGRATPGELLQPMPGLLGRIATSAAALALPLLDEQRREVLLGALQQIQRHTGFMLIHADAQAADDPSPFVYAAPRRLVVAEASASGATEAYRLIKQLAAAGAGSLHVAVARARSRSDAAAFFASLEGLVRRHVGVALAWLGEVERDDLATGLAHPVAQSSPREAEHAFLHRLASLGPGAAPPRTLRR
ncbi:MinD/ParA family ATP-binding protein [Pseudothauera rhizosphaerae]|uniref:MinD/ParA family protein n=1 Tax=Pseudothauera rhizosphaerae TaxID=2565932 RepID=A0A4S4AXZ5_9RHOO|nr:MinD/ParA family protein [Pseudothauera rhizosphaerae]THF64198.1 MinD/ParA family protein [Pseudothauera rhizosphaerae]